MIKENYWYKKEFAQLISGVAVLLMVVHHFFGFKSYLLPDVSWTSLCQLGGIEVERIVGAFGKICVSLYAFNTGYAMWVNRGHYQKKRCDVNRILKFLVSYWVVCLLFYLYAIAVGDRNPSGTDLLLTLVGLATGPIDSYVNVSFAWYVSYYILFIAYARLWLCLFSTKPSIIGTVSRLCGYSGQSSFILRSGRFRLSEAVAHGTIWNLCRQASSF